MVSWVRTSLARSVTWRLKSARMRCTVIQPMASAKAHRITNVSSAETAARRTRIGSRSKLAERRRASRSSARSRLSTKAVAGPPYGGQQAGLAAVLELTSQVRDEHLDRVGRRERVVAPHLVE